MRTSNIKIELGALNRIIMWNTSTLKLLKRKTIRAMTASNLNHKKPTGRTYFTHTQHAHERPQTHKRTRAHAAHTHAHTRTHTHITTTGGGGEGEKRVGGGGGGREVASSSRFKQMCLQSGFKSCSCLNVFDFTMQGFSNRKIITEKERCPNAQIIEWIAMNILAFA